MLQAAFRSPAVRSAAYQSVRCLASKPPPPRNFQPKAAGAGSTNPSPAPPPPPPPAAASHADPAEALKPIAGSSMVPSLDFSPGEEEAKQARTGARSSKDSLSSIERRRRFLGRVSLAMMLAGTGVVAWYMGRDWEEDELKAKKLSPAEATHSRWERTKARFTGIFDTFTEPLWPELLPPPLQGHMHRPYTLLLSVDDLLVTSTWDRQHGWRTAKRPGVDYFLAYMSQFYEIVIFTTQYHYTAMPIIDKLDPYQFYIIHRLFRDACRSENGGTPVKDLKYLNRDLSKVILLDTHPEHVTPNPENAVVLPKWTGDPKDKGLIAMIPFLESIAIFNTPDVRPVLQAYEGKNIPIEYAKKEAEMKRKHLEEWEHSRKGISRGGLTLSSLFGGSQQPSAASNVPLTYLEQKRLEAQRQYLEEQEYMRQNKENFDRLIKEEQEAMAREMPSTFWGAAQAILAGGPQPPPAAGQPPAQSPPPTQQPASAGSKP
ncbi:HAD-like domain-containing protein [Daedaleopsis nitida]|nr:HAD-like domain-containing protein [Daedaleopsis nitida]